MVGWGGFTVYIYIYRERENERERERERERRRDNNFNLTVTLFCVPIYSVKAMGIRNALCRCVYTYQPILCIRQLVSGIVCEVRISLM